MRRFGDWIIWIPAIALIATFLAGLFYSLIAGDPHPRVDPLDWFGK